MTTNNERASIAAHTTREQYEAHIQALKGELESAAHTIASLRRQVVDLQHTAEPERHTK